MSSLQIYKASAGSGKTFSIVKEYLELVFQRPSSYRNILAVTFTNKATAEMKDRILKELSLLSKGEPSGHRDFLKKTFGKSDQEIQQTATKILKSILHDYSRFSVSTIDSFFQRVIRSFSREIRLNASYRTEIDSRRILEEAVDRLFLEIDTNEALRSWMLNYAEEKLVEGKNWNFREELISRGEQLFNEEYKNFGDQLLEKLNDKEYLNRYNSSLKNIIEQYENDLKEMGRKGIDLIGTQGLTVEDFKYGKSSFASHFVKLSNGNFSSPANRVLEARNNVEAWGKSTDKPALKDRIQSVYDAGLNDLLVQSIDYLNNEGIPYHSAKAVLANLFSFGLLTDIARKIKEVSIEKNMVLLNDSGQLLSRIISGNDTPFVYEKMGAVYRHFMLDEFQDTSRLQWHNFRPLVGNALAEGHKSLVVGDVKQSIYRWRNGDWNLLANQVESDFKNLGTDTVPLDVNWRSSRKVISFNNTIFWLSSRQLSRDFDERLGEVGSRSEMLGAMQGIIERAYSDHFQKYSGKDITEGHVSVRFIENEQGNNKGDYREKALEMMINRIEEAQTQGISPGDIAILVRTKNEGAMAAKALLDRKAQTTSTTFCYDVISNDSLLIGQSTVVTFILNFFRILALRGDDLIRAELIYSYYRLLLPRIDGEEKKEEAIDIHSLVARDAVLPELFQEWLGTGENKEYFNNLLSLPLYELASRIVDSFSLCHIKGEWAHLQSFLDLVLDYGREEPGGLTGFLDWWELVGQGKTVNVADLPNAIRILTIHKSKGLEFKMVIIPFCDWELFPQGFKAPLLWCHPECAPFNLLDLVLVKFGKELEQSVFAEDYYRELLYSMVDNLNLLYVAFTRAVNYLTVLCPYKEVESRAPTNVAMLLQLLMENFPLLDSSERERYTDLGMNWNPGTKTFELGKLESPGSHFSASETNMMLTDLVFCNNTGRLKLRTHSEGYFEFHPNEKSERIGHGKLVHEIFEKIVTLTDIEPALKGMVSEGKITDAEVGEMMAHIQALILDEPFRDWFSGSWKVLNERDILRGSDNRHRPDRVMIREGKAVVLDYKTGEKKEQDIRQVKGYLSDLCKMGYPLSKGYIWYLGNNELIDVDTF